MQLWNVDFRSELEAVLPSDLPNRADVVEKTALHLERIEETNKLFNLTRIVSPRDAAIKHVLDALIPWRLFVGAKHLLDAGTGAGFPGIPLAIALPDLRITMAESTGKKARFVADTIAALGLANASVSAERVEDLTKAVRFDLVTARAFAPMGRALEFLAPALKSGARGLLYKGPDIEQEIAEAAPQMKKLRATAVEVMRYDLPDSMGSRRIVEVRLSAPTSAVRIKA